MLDADVIIHFSKGNMLSLLPQIFPEYEYVVLDKVYNELRAIRNHLDNQIYFMKNISLLPFSPTSEMMKEYAKLTNRFGEGESACMVYCRYGADIIGSSNLRDIRNYCEEFCITYLTTADFLYYAWLRDKMTKEECRTFIAEVSAKGSHLPQIEDISKYRPVAMI